MTRRKAIIDGVTVVNIVNDVNDMFDGVYIDDMHHVRIGYQYVNGVFVEPFEELVETTTQEQTQTTAIGFLGALTDDEKRAIMTAKKTDVMIDVLILTLSVANDIDIDSDMLSGSLAYLESIGVIGTGRSAEIIAQLKDGTT